MSSQPEPTLRALLRDLARADAEDLVQEARDGARARAKTMLEDALVDELLAAAGALGEPRRPATPPGTGAREPSPTGDAWWAYCVLSAQHAPAAAGLEGIEPGTRVEAVVDGELAALVSPVPLAEYGDERLREHLEDIEWLERTARGHETVLERVLHRASIVPLRLCTLYHDRDGVRQMLREHAGALTGSLDEVEGATEWGVKVFREQEDAATESSAEEAGESERPTSGAGYLASRQRERRVAQQRDEMREECAEDVHAAVVEIAREARVNPVQRPEAHGREAEMILNGAYLVDQDRVGEFSRSVSLLQARWGPRGFAVELTGPWPPYNFVSESAGIIS
jgi:hypothetical protein